MISAILEWSYYFHDTGSLDILSLMLFVVTLLCCKKMVNTNTYIFISDFDQQDNFLLEIGTPVVCNMVPVSLKTMIFFGKMQSAPFWWKSFPEFLVVHGICLLMVLSSWPLESSYCCKVVSNKGIYPWTIVAKLFDIFISRRKIRKDVQSCI